MSRPRLIMRDGLTEYERLQVRERVRRTGLPRREHPPRRLRLPPSSACLRRGLVSAVLLTLVGGLVVLVMWALLAAIRR